MRDYAVVSPLFWTGDTGKQIRKMGHRCQVIALYLMTSPSSNMIGLYYLPLPTLCHETGIRAEIAKEILLKLQECGFAYYDDTNEHVFIPEMAKFQIAKELGVKDNRRIAVIKMLDSVAIRCPIYANLFIEHYNDIFNLNFPIYPAGPSHERIPKSIIAVLYERDKGSCRGCGGVPKGSDTLQVDHIVAKILGGKTEIDNLQLLCASCNAEKAAQDRSSFWDKHLGRFSGNGNNPSRRGLEGVKEGCRSQEQDQEQEQYIKKSSKKSSAGALLTDLLDSDSELKEAFDKARVFFPKVGDWFGKSFKQYGDIAVKKDRDEILATFKAIAQKQTFDGDPWGYATKTFFGIIRNKMIKDEKDEHRRRAGHIYELYKDFKNDRAETH